MSEHPKQSKSQVMDGMDSLHLFLESLDLINRAIQGTSDPDKMMRDVLDSVLDIFHCDRAYLLYPCDPQARAWRLPMERVRPECPGVFDSTRSIPMEEAVSHMLQRILDSEGPVIYGGGNEHVLEGVWTEQSDIRAHMAMALYPKGDIPWLFGIHQCSCERVWTKADSLLFTEIGRRVEAGLSLSKSFQVLAESESNFSRIVNLANEGIWVLDAEGRTTFANAKMTEMLGYTTAEMWGRPVTDFMFEEDIPDYLKKFKSKFKTVSEPYERRYRRKSGEVLWALVSATGILDDKEQFVSGFAMLSDITEKRLAEEALRRLNDELETRVNERTMELRASHAELEAAYRELKLAHANILQQEKMASIGQLAQGIAHEINTPAQTVRNNIEFAGEALEELMDCAQACSAVVSKVNRGEGAMDSLGALVKRFEEMDLDYINEELPRALLDSAEGMARIAEIVGAMKEFAQPSEGDLKPVDLLHLIEITVNVSSNTWKTVADLEVVPDTEKLVVAGLSDELGQVLLNLILNAADAIAEKVQDGLGKITIRTRASESWAEIEIEDNGCGIAPDLQQKIFEPFFTTKPVGRGSGQGLAIAYHIVKDKHGGELLVDSAPDQGSRFIVRLPRAGNG